MQYDAFIVAGGRAPWLKDIAGTDIRCLAPLHKQRMLDYVLKAMLASKRFKQIVIAIEEDAIPLIADTLPENVSLCAAGRDLPSTCIKAASFLTADDNVKILGVCDDIPLLTPQAINDFLNQCEKYPDCELYYPIIPKE
ncbi:Acylneuraminate cytidylyltransferase, partial [gut metagenome]